MLFIFIELLWMQDINTQQDDYASPILINSEIKIHLVKTYLKMK